jgi:lipopolysaccharide exporter
LNLNSRELGNRMALGGLILVLLRLSLRAIGLVSVVVLFRILSPEDFGIVALAMIVVGFVEVFAEFGFDQALLRNPNAERHDYDVAWTMNFIRGAAVAAGLWLAAPIAAHWFQEPRLVLVIRVLALAPLLDGLMNIATVDFAKDLQFHKEYKLKVSQKVVSFVVTLIAAFALRDFWALVIGTISSRLAGIVLGYSMHPYRPRLSLKGWQTLIKFSGWIMLNNLVLYAGNQTDKVLVQKSFSVHSVGILRVAEELSGMVMELVWPIERALYAGYVKAVQLMDEFKRTVMRSIGLVAALGLPLSLALGLMAEPIVALVLGPKGKEAVPLVQLFVLHGAIRSCLCGVFPAFMVLNRPDINTKATMAAVTLRLVSLFALFPHFGLLAAPISLVAGSALTFAVLWYRLCQVAQMPWWELPRQLWRPVLASVLMSVGGGLLLPHLDALNSFLQVLLVSGVCVAVYLGCMWAFWLLAGKPDSAESVAIRFFSEQWVKLRQKRL